jgi:phosphate transport system substrate-binding protein
VRATRVTRLFAGLTVAVIAVFSTQAPADAAGAHALIQGSGSGWAANAVNQWIADVTSQGMQVVFTPNGSAQGRKDFALKTTDFGVTDIAYQGTDPATGLDDTSQGRGFVYMPVVAGGTAFPYHVLQNGKLVRNIRLSGLTLAKIFTNKITNWDDPEITADNNGRRLPSLQIIPVVHSEGSGSTAMFTRYLAKEYPSIWGPFNPGGAKMTEYFPRTGLQIAQSGSDGVMNFVTSAAANGAIAFDEYSYALASNYPAIKVLNSAGVYTLPTQYNVAVALTKAIINSDKTSQDYLTQNLDNVYTNSDPRAYALSSYAYMIIPTSSSDVRMTTGKRQTLADYLYFSICQGQQEMGPIGYSPLPINLVQAGFDQIGKLKTADPAVDLTARDVSTCGNPTFIAGQPTVNHLAQIAPQPPSCDHNGQGPCGADQGTFNANPGSTGGTGGTGTSGSGSTATGTGSPGSGSATTATTAIDPNTGLPVANTAATRKTSTGGGSSSAGSDAATANTTILASSDSPSMSGGLAALAMGLLLVGLVVPVILGRRLSRRRGSPR